MTCDISELPNKVSSSAYSITSMRLKRILGINPINDVCCIAIGINWHTLLLESHGDPSYLSLNNLSCGLKALSSVGHVGIVSLPERNFKLGGQTLQFGVNFFF